MQRWLLFLGLVAFYWGFASSQAIATSDKEAIETLRKVGPEGQGNAAASAAWQKLVSANETCLLDLLRAMDGANPIALNWLRSAIDAIVVREKAKGSEVSVAQLKEFLADTQQHPRARHLAFELLAESNPAAAETLLDGMMNDPSTELRRQAIARLMGQAQQAEGAGAIEKYRTALSAARDVDQIEAITKALKDRGQQVKLAEVFGWISEWKVIGPFNSTGAEGFEKVYPPEEKLDYEAEYDGKTGPVRWQSVITTNEYGLVDFNKPMGALKEVAGYAVAEIKSDTARPVELRLGSKNAWKIWCNGKFLFGREEYHRGAEIDQYRMKADLKAGVNYILVKVGQNAQTEDWTKEWEFQLRITDESGTPIRFANN